MRLYCQRHAVDTKRAASTTTESRNQVSTSSSLSFHVFTRANESVSVGIFYIIHLNRLLLCIINRFTSANIMDQADEERVKIIKSILVTHAKHGASVYTLRGNTSLSTMFFTDPLHKCDVLILIT